MLVRKVHRAIGTAKTVCHPTEYAITYFDRVFLFDNDNSGLGSMLISRNVKIVARYTTCMPVACFHMIVANLLFI